MIAAAVGMFLVSAALFTWMVHMLAHKSRWQASANLRLSAAALLSAAGTLDGVALLKGVGTVSGGALFLAGAIAGGAGALMNLVATASRRDHERHTGRR